MEKARKLILNTDLKIGAIAEMVGYGSTKHFTRIYKEKFGTRPMQTVDLDKKITYYQHKL